MGIALVEAMAAGCACVASEVGPIPEVMRHGVDGWLVRPGDPEALAAAVNELLDDPARRASLATAARESALARFRPEPAARALAALYVSMVEQVKTGRIKE
jgi:glycosyltransferase involved in cell wall biosynthesis